MPKIRWLFWFVVLFFSFSLVWKQVRKKMIWRYFLVLLLIHSSLAQPGKGPVEPINPPEPKGPVEPINPPEPKGPEEPIKPPKPKAASPPIKWPTLSGMWTALLLVYCKAIYLFQSFLMKEKRWNCHFSIQLLHGFVFHFFQLPHGFVFHFFLETIVTLRTIVTMHV